MNTASRRLTTGALLILVALLPLLASCDIEAGDFTLEDRIHLTFRFHGNQVPHGAPIVVESDQIMDLMAVVRRNGFTADEVASARIATVAGRPEIEIALPFTERLARISHHRL